MRDWRINSTWALTYVTVADIYYRNSNMAAVPPTPAVFHILLARFVKELPAAHSDRPRRALYVRTCNGTHEPLDLDIRFSARALAAHADTASGSSRRLRSSSREARRYSRFRMRSC